MSLEGPLLEILTRRLAECPADFLAEPRFGQTGSVHVGAVVSDVLVRLGGSPLTAAQAEPFRQKDAKKYRNHYGVVLIACWLLAEEWFQSRGIAVEAARFLTGGLDELGSQVKAPQWVTDADRREELARLCLRALGYRPQGETEAQAQDRLATLNTAERQRVLAATRAAEARAREIREAMARKAAEEAADKWTRE